MAQWGRNDQSVTANSTTTKESSNGAPMGTYALVKAAGSTSLRVDSTNAHFGNTSAGSRAAIDVAMFGNTTPGAFIPNLVAGVFSVDATEMQVNRTNGRNTVHAGHVYRTVGTGPIKSISFTGGTASGYNNADVIVIKSYQAGGNATVTMSTNSTGGNLSLTISNVGSGFTVATVPVSNVFITNSTGGTAAGNTTVTNFVVTAGGRAGRIQVETLVAMGSLGAQTAAYGTPALVSDTTDGGVYPNS